VQEADGTLSGVEAVIDKYFASHCLAELVDAELFIVLTGVDYVFVNYNKPDQEKLENVTVAELEEYIKQNQFAPGSMLPK
ncbi:carbamate kinase, partial [Streptococcus suis]